MVEVVVIEGVVEVVVEYLCCGIVAIFSHRMMIVTMFYGTDFIMMMVMVTFDYDEEDDDDVDEVEDDDCDDDDG